MNAAPERARTFVALPLGRELGVEVAARCAAALDPDAFRAAGAEGLHLTLFFLGKVERARLAALAAALRAALAERTAPALRLSGTGAFPSLARVRVLWVGVEERAFAGRLAACRQAVLSGLAGVGVDTRREEQEVFRPHVSVARPRGRRGPAAKFGALSIGLDWNPEGVVLLESCPASPGSRYVCLERFPFARED